MSNFFRSRARFAVPKFSRAKINFEGFFFYVGPKLGKDQKKNLLSDWVVFFAQNQVKTKKKKKVFGPPLPMNLMVFSKETRK